MTDNRIPVTIITGFLGAGKTTLLNNIIKKNPGKKIAIIENEFGETSIDTELVVSAEGGLFEMSNGCICCALNNDLHEVLYKILQSDKKIDHLIVETTGIADPSPITMTFLSDISIQGKFRLDGTVTLVDVLHIEQQIKEAEEPARQIAVADVILLNKYSEAEKSGIKNIEEIISRMNPFAKLISCDRSKVEGFDLLNINAFSKKNILSLDFSLAKKNIMPKPSVHTDIESHSFVFRGTINPVVFDSWMTILLFSSNIFRIKGILNMAAYDHKFIFQAVCSQFVGELGPEWESETRENKIVFIGKKLDRNMLEDGLNKSLQL